MKSYIVGAYCNATCEIVNLEVVNAENEEGALIKYPNTDPVYDQLVIVTTDLLSFYSVTRHVAHTPCAPKEITRYDH